jgi:hypothetical protein
MSASGVMQASESARRRCGLRWSMEKHDVADETEAKDDRREPDRFDEV